MTNNCQNGRKSIIFLELIRELRLQDTQPAPNLGRDRLLQGGASHGHLLPQGRHNRPSARLVNKQAEAEHGVVRDVEPPKTGGGRRAPLLSTCALLHEPHPEGTENVSLAARRAASPGGVRPPHPDTASSSHLCNKSLKV